MAGEFSDIGITAGPVVFSSDLGRSASFYRSLPGFQVKVGQAYLEVKSSVASLQVLPTLDPDLLTGMAVSLPVCNIRDLYRSCGDHAVAGLGALQDDAAGAPRFSVSDPDGNSLYFIERPT